MSQLERLKWIPMLIKAYSDLQVKKALEDQRKVSRGKSKPVASAGPVAQKANAVVTKAAGSSLNGNKPKEKPAGERPINRTRPGAATPDLNYQSIMRELRETRLKLNRLEAFHEQLTATNRHLEHQFEQLISRMDEQRGGDSAAARERSESQ